VTALLSFWPLLRPHLSRFSLALLLSLAALGAGAGLLGVSGWFLTAAATTTAAAAFNLFGPSALVRGLSMLRIGSRYGEKLVGHDATLRLLADIRVWTFAALFPRAPLAAADVRHGDLVSRLTADVDTLDSAFLTAIAPVAAALALGACVTGLLAVTLPDAAVIYAALFFSAALLVPMLLVFTARKAGRETVEASAGARIAVLDGIEGHADLVALGATGEAQLRFAAAAARLGTARGALGDRTCVAAAAVQLLAGATLVLLLWVGLQALAQGTIGGPLLAGLLLAGLGSFEACAMLVRNAGRLTAAAAAAERLRGLASSAPPVAEPRQPQILPAGSAIAFENVTFGYDPQRPVLRRLDLAIAAGSRVAILGPSGSGKSTLLALLLRLADPQAGSVRIAGADLRTVASSAVHQRVALLSQQSPVFLDTIRANLQVGGPEASEGEMWDALGSARLADFVHGLAGGLDAYVGEAGKTLSAGEARRLCLARTLLSNAPILVLDEPTSGLDAEAERAFLEDLAAATSGRTVVLVTHAALPEDAVDRVYRLQHGSLSAA
jgi:ATP-binding cassette subfamily C protein CydC